ncbi:pistil-specific extensin-like protein [Cryptomeria japonica]|uniref:pistil-specific extensin-like protein n=1 Tax=Cryptomeria japonica TaxID=3369 RepID=UPI0027DA6C9F|nr:pistil-specific extensin-like protein [Cryptomeria japonica]
MDIDSFLGPRACQSPNPGPCQPRFPLPPPESSRSPCLLPPSAVASLPVATAGLPARGQHCAHRPPLPFRLLPLVSPPMLSPAPAARPPLPFLHCRLPCARRLPPPPAAPFPTAPPARLTLFPGQPPLCHRAATGAPPHLSLARRPPLCHRTATGAPPELRSLATGPPTMPPDPFFGPFKGGFGFLALSWTYGVGFW